MTAEQQETGPGRPLAGRWLWCIAAIYLAVFPYFGALRHANELPRVLTTEELLDHRAFSLDARLADLGSYSDISTTPDGRHYQNKAPGLAMLGTPLYAALRLAYLPTGHRPTATVVTWLLRRHLAGATVQDEATSVPLSVQLVHLGFLAGVVLSAHHPVIFLGLFLFFQIGRAHV